MRLHRFSLATCLAACAWAAEGDPREFFESRIRPLLAKNCFVCHTSTRMGGLEMVSREAFLKGGNSGPALQPGQPDRSLLLEAVRHTHARLKMPPQGKLSEEEIADLAAWIKAGAIWNDAPPAARSAEYTIRPEQRAFWAFQPVRLPAVPAVRNKSWPRSPVDRFILAALESRSLVPGPFADKRTLLRRAYLDLIGLPPAPEEVDRFLADRAPDAFSRVVDILLASPRYGERWGRYWLDVARYSDDKLNSTQDEPYPNAWRYRDWVVQAFNADMPYDKMVAAQIAGDLMERPGETLYTPGLGLFALSPQFQEDRVDTVTRGFLALTVACAQCHDHKYDPIPTKDYYSLLGVFTSTETAEVPLAAEPVVRDYRERKKSIEDQEARIREFLEAQANQLAEILAARTARYLEAARTVLGPAKADAKRLAASEQLDAETLDRWVQYLPLTPKEHPFLNDWRDADRFRPAGFQDFALALLKEKKSIEETNLIRLGGSRERGTLSRADLVSLERDKYFLWRDLFSPQRVGKLPSGVFYYKDAAIDRFLHGAWKTHLEAMRADLAALKTALPPQYPFLHVIRDAAKPKNERVRLRGNPGSLGEEAPRRFLAVLSHGGEKPFANGSGRLELAQAIASPDNPLTARVMANRVWQGHFGAGLVRTASNFGQLGEPPSHPELLDWLAARLVEQRWSLKALHREIVLSATYALGAAGPPNNVAADPDNRLLWRANRRRLDVEALRDSLLAASGELDLTAGGPPLALADEKNLRRTVYGFVSRRRLDGTLALFDFPNPNSTSERRIETTTPLQQLFFLNSGFVRSRARALERRLGAAGETDQARIANAYRLLYGRAPAREEVRLGLQFLKTGAGAWTQYTQALLGSNEFVYFP